LIREAAGVLDSASILIGVGVLSLLRFTFLFLRLGDLLWLSPELIYSGSCCAALCSEQSSQGARSIVETEGHLLRIAGGEEKSRTW